MKSLGQPQEGLDQEIADPEGIAALGDNGLSVFEVVEGLIEPAVMKMDVPQTAIGQSLKGSL
mgnify:CR=1 FL=1